MRMRFAFPLMIGIAMGGGLAGCSVFGDDEEEAAPAAAEEQAARRPVPVQALQRIEVGRTRNGYAIIAFGTAPGTGYAAPRLTARRDGRPGPDGVVDYDFLAVPPDPALNLPQGTIDARAIRADLRLSERAISGIAGIRVHTLTNTGQLSLAGAEETASQ